MTAPSFFSIPATTATSVSSQLPQLGSGAFQAPAITAQNVGATTIGSALQNTNDGNIQNIFQDASKLAAAVSGPELYGDERDRVIALLNQLLASSGIGSGYYRTEEIPYVFTTGNPFHRLKGIGYNRLSKHKNTDGIVSLVLKIYPNQLENPQQKQALIDTINTILRGRPPTSFSTIGAAQQQSRPVGSIQVEVKSIIPLGEQLTEVMIACSEAGKGTWTVAELFHELTQADKLNTLKQQLFCEKIVPRIEVDKGELEKYLKRSPPGFEEIWAHAVKNNPDPDNLVPYPIQGFQQLIQRQKMQKSLISAQETLLKDFATRLDRIERDVFASHNKYTKCRQMQKQLSHRLLRVLGMQTLIQRYGLTVDEKEEQLQCRLEAINAQLNAPEMIKSKIQALYDLLKRDSDLLKKKIQERQANANILKSDMRVIRRCLASRQTLLENLVEEIKSSAETQNTMERSREK